MLDPADASVMALYLAGIAFVGALFYRRDAGLKEYLLGNRVMRWLPVSLSILAADTSIISYLGFPAWAFRRDMRLSLTAFNTLLAVPFVVWRFLPAFSQLRFYSIYEFLEGRFNLTLRLATSLLF